MLGVVRVRLAPGVEPERAIAEIRQLAGNKASAVGATARHPVDQRVDYVRWTTDAETRLASILRRQDAQAFFDSPRHGDICSMPPGNQLTTLIYAELEVLTRGLQQTVDDLEGYLRRMRAAPGFPVVVDTNVLLECQRLDSVTWPAEIGEARVMVPLRVIEEIDAKKYGDSKRLRSIARELSRGSTVCFPVLIPVR